VDVTNIRTLETARFRRWQVAFLAGIGITITACEYIFAYQNVAYGIVVALGLVIVIYLLLSIFHLDQRITNCAESLTLLPLYILFTSSLPWFFINQQYLLPAVYSCILALCLWYVYQKNLSLKELFGFGTESWQVRRLKSWKVRKLEGSKVRRFQGWGVGNVINLTNLINLIKLQPVKFVLVGLAIGIPLGIGEYFVLYPAPAFPAFEVKYLLRDMVYMLCFVGLGEELLFRGLIQRDLTGAFGWKWGLVGASLMFAVMHLTWRSIPELGFVFAAGLVLGALYWKTKSLVPGIVAHAINNVMLVSVMPYILS